MNINLHNYETYLLQYIDNELSAVEVVAVESFIQQHPQIQKELDEFLAVKLMDDFDESSFDKTSLLKHESTFVTEANFEALCCQYVDGALTEIEKSAVETYAAKSNDATTMLGQFIATKLPVEIIAFPNKKLLLKEEKNTKIIPLFGWQKMAAAAAIIGIIFTVSYNGIFNKKQTPLAETANNKTKVILPKNDAILNAPNTATKATYATNEAVAVANKKQAKNTASVIEKNKALENTIEKNTRENYAANTVITTSNENVETAANTSVSSQNALSKFADIIAAENNFEKNSNLTYTASYNIIDTDNEEDNSMYVGAIQLNKNKMKGLLKKAKSLFGVKKSKQPDEDANDLLQVANLEINTNRTLK